jgi:hypothetical protein
MKREKTKKTYDTKGEERRCGEEKISKTKRNKKRRNHLLVLYNQNA